MTSNEPPLLTRVGRARLEERARRLEEETIPALVEAIEEEDDEMAPRLELDLAQRELEQLKYVLETAGSVYDIPEDPGIVQIGDWVSVKTEDGEEVRHLIVHPAEAGRPLRVSGDVVSFDPGPGATVDAINESEEDAQRLNPFTSAIVLGVLRNRLAAQPIEQDLDRLNLQGFAVQSVSDLHPTGWIRAVLTRTR